MNFPDRLPDNPEELKKIILSMMKNSEEEKKEKESLKNNNLHLTKEISNLQKAITKLERRLSYFLRDKFGRKSEKISPEDLYFGYLFDEAEVGMDDSETLYDNHSESEHVKGYERKKSGRKPLPENLPRKESVIDIPLDERICNCGCNLNYFGDDVSEQLVYKPSELYVNKIIRKKYVCRNCSKNGTESLGPLIQSAPLPASLLPKSNLSPSLFTEIIVSKFMDHIPLYRMEKIFLRHGVEIPRATLSNWTLGVYERHFHKFEFLHKYILSSKLLGIDESSLKVMKENSSQENKKSYMWLIRGGKPARPILLYIYQPTRSAHFLVDYLKNYSGVIQVDGFQSYETHLGKNEKITLVACMAHIRREFEKCWKSNKNTDAKIILDEIRKIYLVEKEIRILKLHELEDYSKIFEIRKMKSEPLMDKIYSILEKYNSTKDPESDLAKATRYALGQWSKMKNYLIYGESYIDNNMVENGIRPFVLGRKNWLFSGSPRGADASAFWYSIIQTFKANTNDYYNGFLKLMEGLPGCKNSEECEILFRKSIGWDN